MEWAGDLLTQEVVSKISAYICVRNAIELDYCLVAGAESLIPVADELVICDGESTDGTLDLIKDLMARDSRVRMVTYPWTNPHNVPDFWVNWLNFARNTLRHPMQLTIDADEVLAAQSYPAILELAAQNRSAMFHRLNFWQDAEHLAPENRCCGTMVARMGPSNLYMPSDEPHPAQRENVRKYAVEDDRLLIYHYGFIRDPQAFVRKSIVVQNMFFGSVDARITDMADQGKSWKDRDYFEGLPLRQYTGKHPTAALPWLRKNGYDVE